MLARIISTQSSKRLTHQFRKSTGVNIQPISQILTNRCNEIINNKCRSTASKSAPPNILNKDTPTDKEWIGADKYNEVDTSSNRHIFRITPVIPSILTYIEKVGVGLPARGKNAAKRRRKTLVEDNPNENITPPPPFASTGQTHTVSKWRQYSVNRIPIKTLSMHELKEDDSSIPEIALAGRSNVGKSTLLNALLYSNIPVDKIKQNISHMSNRKKEEVKSKKVRDKLYLAKGAKAFVSPKPGETRSIITYELNSKLTPIKDESHAPLQASLRLVDLPGYGFAFADEEKAKQWRGAMKNYILRRGKKLKRLLLLIDSRHGMKNTDVEFLGMIQDDFKEMEKQQNKKDLLPPIQIVLTKCDLMRQKDLARRVVIVKKQLSEVLAREPSKLPIMLVQGQVALAFKKPRHLGKNGMLELHRELASLVNYK